MTNDELRTPLHYAVLGGNFNTVELLVENGALVKLPEDYNKPPPLFFAVLKEDFEMMKYLVKMGADVNDGSAVIGSALHVALSELGENKVTIFGWNCLTNVIFIYYVRIEVVERLNF